MLNLYDFAALRILNVASTRFARDGEYQASAAEMVKVLRTDERFRAERYIMSFDTRSMGVILGRLSQNQPLGGPLVERVGGRRWRLTRAGLRVLGGA